MELRLLRRGRTFIRNFMREEGRGLDREGF